MGGFAKKFFIAKVLPSDWQLLANTGHAKDLQAHVPYHMRVEFHGHRIKLFHNGVLVLSAIDSTYSSGLCGLRTNRTQARFENVDIAAVRTSEHEIDQASTQISQAMTYPGNKNVFIVHGHDEAKKWELKNFLTKLGVRPIVLHEQDDLGKVIIEKFEYYASQSAFAFILMTPDDQTTVASSDEAKWRARQNVIMELGWFMAKLGRNRVGVLYKGDLEIPSDIYGLLYLEFRNSVQEVGEKIRQRLQGVGLIP
jgi:predicted nucleotide-binding protein